MNPTLDTMELMKTALSKGDDISKSITTSIGLVAYDLQAPAKNLYPIFTPLRNSIPRIPGGTGVATNWKQITSIVGSGFDNTGWIPEGQRSGTMSYTTAPKAANYVTMGEEDSVTFEAESAGRTFEDVRATMAMRLLQKQMLKEENAILGGNQSLALGTVGTVTTSVAGTTGTLPALTYSVICVALTQEGYYNSSLSAGIAQSKTVTGADAKTYTVNGGSSIKSAAAAQAVTLGQILSVSVTPVRGAAAYAWFVGAAAAEKLEAITSTAFTTFSVPLVGGTRQAAASNFTADCSTNAGAFDGLLTAALNPANTAYVNTMANGNSGLTASGRGSVIEIDTMLQNMYDIYQLSPTVLYVSTQESKNITQKVMVNAQGSLVRYNTPNSGAGSNEPYGVVAGGTVSSYFNPFMPDGGAIIPIKIHPKVPPGTIMAYAERLPMYYQNNEVSNVVEMKCRRDYYQIDWPIRTRAYETGVYAEVVLAIYATFGIGIINNIANL